MNSTGNIDPFGSPGAPRRPMPNLASGQSDTNASANAATAAATSQSDALAQSQLQLAHALKKAAKEVSTI